MKEKLGCLKSPIDERDYKISKEVFSDVNVPENFILNYKYKKLDQGNVGSCVAHALAECKSFIDDVDIDNMYSVGFIYGNREEGQSQGTGMYPREALKNLVKYGDCFQVEFPVNEEYPFIKETIKRYGRDRLLRSASNHKSSAYISLDLEQIKQYLYKQQKPVIIGVEVYSNFYNAKTNKGIIPAEPKGTYRGNHLMLVIGYKNNQLVIVNSWGEDVGDNGIFYLDLNSKIIQEFWVLEDKKIIKPVNPTKPESKILYRLQLGAFKNYNNAVNYSKELNSKGIATCIKRYPDLYKIQVGAFLNKDNCIKYQKELHTKGYDCFIIQEN